MSKPRSLVKDIRASFEALSAPTLSTQPIQGRFTKTGDLANANMLPKLQPIKATIDTVISRASDQLQSATTAPAPDSPPRPSSALIAQPSLPTRRLSSIRPSWIGPRRTERIQIPGSPAMKRPVTIEYASQGLQPPVYLFTSLSDPQWEAVQMDSEKREDGEFRFTKAFDAEEGEYQYKFRLGPGDWWACDEAKPVVDDGAGNKNNLLVVKPAEPTTQPQPASTSQPATSTEQNTVAPVLAQSKHSSDQPELLGAQPKASERPVSAEHAAPTEPAEQPSTIQQALPATAPNQTSADDQRKDSVLTKPTPSDPAADNVQEAQKPPMPSTGEQPSAIEQPKPSDAASSSAMSSTRTLTLPPVVAVSGSTTTPASTTSTQRDTNAAPSNSAPQSPMLQRPLSIKLPPTTGILPLPTPQAATPAPGPLSGHELFSPPSKPVDEKVDETPEDEDDVEAESPLLRHETLNPDSDEQTHAPLLRHESTGLSDKQDEVIYHSRSSSAVLAPSDGSRRSSIEDAVAPEADPNDPTLERFPTDQDGIFEHIRRASYKLPEDETRRVSLSAVSEASTSPVTSLPSVQEDDEEMEHLPSMTAEEEDKEVDPDVDPIAPAVIVSEAPAQFPAALMTPPMTPKEQELEIVKAVAGEREAELVAANMAADEEDDKNSKEKVIIEVVQERGFFAVLTDIATHPISWLAIAGIAMAVVAGIYKLR